MRKITFLLFAWMLISMSCDGSSDNIEPNGNEPQSGEGKYLLSKMKRGDVVTTYQYNDAKQLISSEKTENGRTIKRKYSYEGDKVMKQEVFANGEFLSRYEYKYDDNKLVESKLYDNKEKLQNHTILNYDKQKRLKKKDYTSYSEFLRVNPTKMVSSYEWNSDQKSVKVITKDAYSVIKFDGKKHPMANVFKVNNSLVSGMCGFAQNELERKSYLDGGIVQEQVIYSYEYNQAGYPIKKITAYKDGGKQVTTYEYIKK